MKQNNSIALDINTYNSCDETLSRKLSIIEKILVSISVEINTIELILIPFDIQAE